MNTNQISKDVNPEEIYGFFAKNKSTLNNVWWLANAISPQCTAKRRGWSGGNLKLGQDPGEFAQWLIMLARHQVKSYTEIGCWSGGSLYFADSYLRATVEGFQGSTGIDITSKRLVGFDGYKARHKSIRFIESDSKSESLEVSTEAAFIDGDHSEKAMLSDWGKCKNVTKLVGFHDIKLPTCGCPMGWNNVAASNNTSELISFTPKERWMKGIGVVYMQRQ